MLFLPPACFHTCALTHTHLGIHSKEVDPSELMVHELTGENHANVAKEIDFLGLEPTAEGNRESREQAGLAEHCCTMHVCLGSLRASRERLHGQNPAAESGSLCQQLYQYVGIFNRPF